MSAQAFERGIDMGVALRFAPKIFVHPYERNLPDSVENYFRSVYLMNSQGIPLATTVTADTLQQYNDPGNYLRFASDDFPTAANDFSTGAPIQPTENPDVGRITAPVYAKTFQYPTHIDIKYIFFYPFNGFQVFRIGVLSGFSTKKRNFEWARFARHEGDWEHITVRLDPSGQVLQGVFYAQHSGSAWVSNPPLIDGTHPVVMSALNSHASYATSDSFALETILNPPGLAPIGWLKVADTTTTDGTVTYAQPDHAYTAVEWAPYSAPGQLVLLDDNAEAAKWLGFTGRWGPPALDNTHIDRPPALPKDAQDELFNLAKIGKVFLPARLTRGDGPASPQQQNWWNEKEL